MNLLFTPPRGQEPVYLLDSEEYILYKNHQGLLHRPDGPARIFKKSSGIKEEYYFLGELHRGDGPARVWHDGSFEYYYQGLLSGGGDGPSARRFFAVDDQAKEEWRDEKGLLHRTNGPAVILSDGSEFYYQEGLLHRTDGPAIVRDTLEARKNALREKKPFLVWYNRGEKSRVGGPAEIYGHGAQVYWLNGEMHRLDGPAIVHTDRIQPQGYRYGWMKHGRPHRSRGPAIVDSLGVEFYYDQGVLHNVQGPAIVYPSGKSEYYLEGVLLTKNDWQDIVGL